MMDPQPALVPEVVPPQEQNFALTLEHDETALCPLPQPIQVPLIAAPLSYPSLL